MYLGRKSRSKSCWGYLLTGDADDIKLWGKNGEVQENFGGEVDMIQIVFIYEVTHIHVLTCVNASVRIHVHARAHTRAHTYTHYMPPFLTPPLICMQVVIDLT